MTICNVCFDMMVGWVLAEKQKGRLYYSNAQAIPAFTSYLTDMGWTQEQANAIAAKAAT